MISVTDLSLHDNMAVHKASYSSTWLVRFGVEEHERPVTSTPLDIFLWDELEHQLHPNITI